MGEISLLIAFHRRSTQALFLLMSSVSSGTRYMIKSNGNLSLFPPQLCVNRRRKGCVPSGYLVQDTPSTVAVAVRVASMIQCATGFVTWILSVVNIKIFERFSSECRV